MLGSLYRRFTKRFPRFSMWVVRHPRWSSVIGVAAVAVIVAAAILVPPLLASCGPGMVEDGGACVGVDLASQSFRSGEPAEMQALEAAVKANNDAVSNDYVSVVLLQDLSPVAGVDTTSYPDVYPDIEGALTAAWQANHTAAYSSLPKVKLFLGNMGSANGGWSAAVDQITASAAANHITSVIGLGQSTDATRAAAERIVDDAHVPVIGATVTGDTMNFAPNSTRRDTGFFRVPATNADNMAAAARYIASITPDQSRVAIMQDNAAGDDYNQTLARAADADLPKAHQFPFTSPGSLPAGVQRDQELIQQFAYDNQNICSVNPAVVYFAGRGQDLGAFLQSWTQSGTPCATGALTVVTGDDGQAAIDEPAVQQAVQHGVRVLFTAEASPDEWGRCAGGREQEAYDTFQAAFTGKPDVCTGQPVTAADGAVPLSYDPAHLRGGQAMLTHDATVVAVTAARRADKGADQGDGGLVVRTPIMQVGIIEEMRCDNAVLGASGWIEYSQDPANYGNPIDKPVPIVQVNADGSTVTVPNWAGTSVRNDPRTTC